MKIRTIIGLCMVLALTCGTASAWLSGYDHRMEITVNNAGASTLNYYQFNFTNDTNILVAAGDMQASGADCRVTNASDNLIPFWNATAFNATDTKIWANATTLPVGDNTFYMYYGNSGVSSVANIMTTFDFGDDFSTDTLTRIDEPSNPTRTPDDVWEGSVLCEQSDFYHGGEYISWYRGHGSGTYETGFENSTDGVTWTAYPSNPILAHPTVYDYVVQDGDCFYLFVNTDPSANGNGDMYLYNVTDYTNPVIMNGGNAVYTRSPTSTDWDYKIFNPGITIDGDGRWHMLLEGQSSTSGFRVGYAYSNLTEMNWTAHRSSSYVIGTSGNPYLKYVPDRNALLAIHGDKSGSHWKLISHYANLSNDLSSSANWSLSPNFEIAHAGIHTADPHAMFNFNATYPTMISYNYNQASIYQTYSALTLNEFYDTVTTTLPLGKWDTYGTFTYNIADGILTQSMANGNHGILKSKINHSMPHIVEARSKVGGDDIARLAFSTDTSGTLTNQVAFWWAHDGSRSRVATYSGAVGGYTDLTPAMDVLNYHNYEVQWISGSSAKYYCDGVYKESRTTNITTSVLPAWLHMYGWSGGSNTGYWDWIFVRQYTATEPTSSLGAEEDAPVGNIYIPPPSTTLANTTGNFWVNHTWSAGSGNVTDSYNISQNGTWTNASATLYFNATDVGVHGYSDITVWAWNSSGSGTLSATSITQNTTVPNNAIVISDVSSSYSILEGETLSIDANYTDADGDTGTFADNSTEWNVNSGTGIVSWVTVDGDQGTYGWLINVSDGYGSTSTQEFVVTVIDSTPTAVSNMANTTGNFWINWTWDAGANVDDYDVWIDEVDVGADITNLYYNHSASAHATVNISVRSHNHTLSAYSGWVNDTMTVANNAITITNTSDQNVNEGQNIYVDYDATDADSDTPTFSCNRTDLFSDFSAVTGKGNWTSVAGTYYVDFGASDGYGSTSNYTMTITASTGEYIPPDPTTLANATGNFWANHTYSPGSGNVTDSYNVSVNSVWHNTTPAYYNDTGLSAHAWSNVTVYAFNSSGNGTLSSGSVSQDTQIPNNPITITNTSDWSGDEGENVYVDYDATDADSDTPTFSCNRTDLFTDFSTSTGKGNWTSTEGTYYVDFGASDGYGSTSNYTMAITATLPTNITITLHSVSPGAIQTNYTGTIQVNYIVESPHPLNLSTLALLYGINYTTTGDMHSYTAVPSNSLAADGIYRAPYRNTTPYLSWENNATITEGNVWQWGGGDNDSAWINVTSINATHTWINATGHPEHIFQGSFYLGRRAMNTAPKTGSEVNSQQGIIIKMWDNEAIRGRSINYLMNLYFDSDWESTIPTSPIEIWGLNSSFNPDTDDPTTSEWGSKIVEWDGNRWVNHSWIPDANASYSCPLVLNASTFPVIPDEVNYIYLKSDTQSSKSYVLNATNHDPGICNITYAQTETMWTYNELSGASSLVNYTPSFFTTFVRDDEQFLHHLYIADDQGEWAYSDINNISIGVAHYPVEPSSFEYFNITCPAEYDHDTYMDATYDSGYVYVGLYCHADPDGGTVSHNLTIHYANGTIAGIINDTFTTITPGIVEINFSTTPYYSTSDAYTLKCVATDDEGSVATTLLGSVFTLAADGTQGYYVDTYLMFWGMNDVPTLYTAVNNNSLISYDAGDDMYTMHVPFFKSKCNDTFRFNETVHLKSLNTADVAYFKFHGITIFDNATIRAWNTVSDTLAPSTDAYRGYLIAIGYTRGNITNSDLSYLGSDIYRQEGLNFVDNTHAYLIYNTTFSHNGRGMIMEKCENYNISHCNIHDPAEAGIGVYYSNNIVVENCIVSDSVHPGIYLYEANDNIIRYNTIQDCADSGMRIRSNSNNNTLIGNDITGSGVYDYYFSSSSINNTIRDPASMTDNIRVTSTSSANIENTDNSAFTEDSLNSTYAYPTNFSMMVDSVSQTFDITQQDMTVTPSPDSIRMWNLVWGNSVSFNASNVSGAPHVWFNATQTIWANANMSVYRNGTIYYNGTADANGLFTYNYSGGWSGHWFEFVPENIAPDKPTVVVPANGATGTSTNPTLRVLVTDPNSYDTLNVTFYAQGGTQIGSTQTGLANGSTASVMWSGRSYSTTYYWYAVADDGTAQTQSDTWHFRTQTDGGDGGGGGGSSHVILISGCTDWEGNAGSQVYIDFGCTGETTGATFTTNATDGSIDSSSGIYTWNTDTVDVGVYTWRFNVENVYTISDYCDVTITVYHYASPTNLAATTGNFWVNHTWDGNGYVDSYNVSVNGVWGNGSTDQYSYHVTTPHAWSNISVAAYNDTTGLSSFISSDVQVPNNAIVLTNYTTLMLATAGDNVTVDMNHEDLDGDAATYYCSRMDLFTDFNTADGTGQYTNAVNGTHEVIFGVTDGYGWSNQTIAIEVGTVHPLELDEETPLILFVVLVVLLFGSLFYIYHAASYVAKIVTTLISTWMSFMLSNMAVSGNVVLNYAELSSGDVFVYGTHSIQIAALSHFFMFTGVVSALFMLVFAVKLVTDTYLNMQEKRKAEEEWDGVEQ